MINPELHDWWSSKRLTSIKYRGTSLSGAGVSLQVLRKVFTENEFTWFSIVYGDYYDNLNLIPLENDIAGKFNKVSYDNQDSKRAFFGPIWHNEFKITDEIAEELGSNTSNNSFYISNKDKFPFFIGSHDNCFFAIEPISDDLLTKVVHTILQQHSFYMGKDILWQEIETQLVDIIKSNKEISIQSDPIRKCLWIPQIEQDKTWFWKKRKKGTIFIDGDTARFRA